MHTKSVAFSGASCRAALIIPASQAGAKSSSLADVGAGGVSKEIGVADRDVPAESSLPEPQPAAPTSKPVAARLTMNRESQLHGMHTMNGGRFLVMIVD